MTPWQRRLRLGLGVFIVVLAVTLFVSLRRAPVRAPQKPLPARADPNAVGESTFGKSVRLLGDKQDITIEHYDWMGQYPDGRTKVTAGQFKILQRGGRDFVIKARDAEIKGQPPNVDVAMKGSVQVTSSDGLVLETGEATYVDREGVVKAPGPVAFTRNRMSGTAVGMTYDKNRDVLWLLDEVVIHNQADEKGQDGADIEAGAAGLARADKYMRFERGVTIVRGGQTIKSDGGVAYLTPDEQRVQMLELRGSSRVAGTPNADGGLKNMAARDMNLTYGEDGKTLQRAVLAGDAAIDLAGTAGGAGRRLSAQFIDIGLGPDGTVVTALLARDRVVLELAADKTTPARTIKSGALLGSGTPAAGLTDAAFSEGVEFRETPRPPAKPRVAKSSTMSLALKNGFDSIESARFFGGVQFEEGAMTASSREARYEIAAGTLAMAGAHEKTGRQPHVVDEQATIEGKAIAIVLDGQKISATDSVKTEMRDTAQPGERRGADAAARRRPSLLKPGKPVYAISDRLTYDGATSHAEYTGNAQLWQGEMRIKADEIVVDDQSGNMTATGNVDSRLILEQVNAKTKAKEQIKSVATAKDMVYDDSVRRATYTGTAKLNGPDGDLGADKIEIYLQEGGSEIDHLEAYTGVTLRTPDSRRAAGNRLTYLAKDEQYDMAGTPVTLEDESGQTTGNSLRFFRSTDRIVVDGKEQKRTELKRGIKR
jgi:lipopolysaccharide transport protein LptA